MIQVRAGQENFVEPVTDINGLSRENWLQK